MSGGELKKLSVAEGIVVTAPTNGGPIVNADIDAAAAIAGTKIAGGILGVADGTTAAAGVQGYVTKSTFTSSATSPANGNFGNMTTLSLPAGRWLLFGNVRSTAVASQTLIAVAISAFANNTQTDHVSGYSEFAPTIVNHDGGFLVVGIGPIAVTHASTTSYYFKCQQNAGTFSAGSWLGTFFAVQMP